MRVQFSAVFKRHLRERANRKIRAKFKAQLQLFLKNPYDPRLDNHVLHHDWEGRRSFDVDDDYRVIFKEHKGFYRLTHFGNHDQLYRPWKRIK